MSDPAIKVWISKYAIGTKKVFEADAKIHDGTASGTGEHRWRWFYGEGNEWHRTRAGAIAKAEEMRLAKIASLKKQIAKLENLKFE